MIHPSKQSHAALCLSCLILVLSIQGDVLAELHHWRSIGIAHSPSSINCFAQDSSGNLYVGTEGAGLYRSSDLGKSWTLDQLESLSLSTSSLYGNAEQPWRIRTICVAPNNDMYVGTETGLFFRQAGTNEWIPDVTPGRLYLAIHLQTSAKGVIYATYNSSRILRKDNGEDTWMPIVFGRTSPTNFAVSSIGTCLYGAQNLLRSVDSGNTWKIFTLPDTSWHFVSAEPHGVAFVAADTNSRRLALSTDDGLTWQLSNLPSVTTITELQIAPHKVASTDGLVVRILSNDGYFVSTDSCKSWRWNTVVSGKRLTALLQLPSGEVLAGVDGMPPTYSASTDEWRAGHWSTANLTFVSAIGSQIIQTSWGETLSIIDGLGLSTWDSATQAWLPRLTAMQLQPERIVEGKGEMLYTLQTAQRRIYFSSDHGRSWNSPTGMGGFNQDSKIYANPRSEAVFVSDDLGNSLNIRDRYRSTDRGATWSDSAQLFLHDLHYFANGELLALTGSGFMRSSDLGAHWRADSTIMFDPSGRFSLSAEDSLFYVTGSTINLTTDRGTKWLALPDLIPSASFYYITREGVLLAGDPYDGLYLSSDLGKHWVLDTAGLDGSAITSIAETPSGAFFTTTANSSMYYSGPSSTLQPVAATYTINGIYPNPASTQSTAVLTMRTPAHLRVQLYNSIGALQATLFDKDLSIGQYPIQFQIANQAAGAYFLKFESGTTIETKGIVKF